MFLNLKLVGFVCARACACVCVCVREREREGGCNMIDIVVCYGVINMSAQVPALLYLQML